MYIYFDTNGTIKEIVNDLPIRNGNNEANKIYCYIEGEPTIDDIWYLQKLPSGELSNEVSFKNSTITKAIPYDAKRDMKYFKDFVQYKFYVFTLNTFLTSQKGLNIATIRIVIDNEIFALGELTFNVQENVIKVDNGITQSQYDYLLLAYASRTLNEVVGDDLDNLLDDKINAKLGDLADGSPKLFETENEIENEHADYGIAVATDTGYIYVWNDTQQGYQSTGMKYIADVSLFYTKTESDSTFAPKSNAITHTGSQLQDYSGNDIYPNIDTHSNLYKVSSDNLWDTDNLISGKYIYHLSGAVNSNADYSATDYIEVTPNTILKIAPSMLFFAFYDANKDWITNTWTSSQNEILVPATAKYIRLSTTNTNASIQMVFESKLPYKVKTHYLIDKTTIENNDIELEESVNLFNKLECVDGKYRYYQDGHIATSATFFYTLLIDISNYEKLTVLNTSQRQICFFDGSGIFVSGQLSASITKPNGVTYMCVSALLTEKDTMMIVVGSGNDIKRKQEYNTIPIGLIPILECEKYARATLTISLNGDYSDFVQGIVAAYNKGNCDVYIDGVYDLSSNIDTIYASYPSGLPIGKNNRYYFSSKSKVTANYTGSNDNVTTNFSVFRSDQRNGDFEIHNLTIDTSNIRYCIHDENGSASEGISYIHSYINCSFKHDNTNNTHRDTYWHCLGGGLGDNAVINIYGCIFNSVYAPSTNLSDVQYHGNWSSSEDAQKGIARLNVKDNYFVHSFSVSSPNPETNKSTLLYTNNSQGNAIIINGTGTEDKWDIYSWNNEVRV